MSVAEPEAKVETVFPYGYPTCNQLLQPRLRYCPWTPTDKQRLFTILNCFEVFYGGAAGGAKSIALLMAALQFVDVPGYAALLIRRTYQDLALPGGLMETATEWLGPTDAHWTGNTHQWEFPSGAKLVFGYLQNPNDEYRYKSSEFQFVGIDEASEINPKQGRYLITRMRKPATPPPDAEPLKAAPDGLTLADVPLRFRLGSNPGGLYPGSYFNRYVNEKSRKPKVVFIPAKLEDNPHVDAISYEASLREVDDGILYQQLRHGVWDIDPEGAMFKRDAIDQVYAPFDEEGVRRVRFWDVASTEPTKANRDPDWSVGILLARNKDAKYRVESIVRFQADPYETKQRMRRTAERDGKEIEIAIEAIGLNKMWYEEMQRVTLEGFKVSRHTFKTKKKDKVGRADLCASSWNGGNWSMVVDENSEDYLDEMCSFGAKNYKGHDDSVDATSGGFNWMNEKKPVDFAAPQGMIG